MRITQNVGVRVWPMDSCVALRVKISAVDGKGEPS